MRMLVLLAVSFGLISAPAIFGADPATGSKAEQTATTAVEPAPQAGTTEEAAVTIEQSTTTTTKMTPAAAKKECKKANPGLKGAKLKKCIKEKTTS